MQPYVGWCCCIVSQSQGGSLLLQELLLQNLVSLQILRDNLSAHVINQLKHMSALILCEDTKMFVRFVCACYFGTTTRIFVELHRYNKIM